MVSLYVDTGSATTPSHSEGTGVHEGTTILASVPMVPREVQKLPPTADVGTCGIGEFCISCTYHAPMSCIAIACLDMYACCT